jgi:hypothetical protein
MLPMYLHLAVILLYDRHSFDKKLLPGIQIKTLVYLVTDCYDITQRGLQYSHISVYIHHVLSIAIALAAVEWFGMEPGICILANIGTWHRVLYIIFGVLHEVNERRRYCLLLVGVVFWVLGFIVPGVLMVIYLSSNYNVLTRWWIGVYVLSIPCFMFCDIPLLLYMKKQRNLSSLQITPFKLKFVSSGVWV